MLDQTTIFGVISLANFLASFSVGIFILLKAKKNAVNLYYCIFDFSIAFYALFYFFWQCSSHKDLSVFFFKCCILGVVLINTTFVQFTFSLINAHKKYSWFLIVTHLMNIFFSYAAFSLFYTGWQIKYSYGLWPIPSQIFGAYLIWWFFQVGLCLYLLFSKGILKTQDRERKRFQLIFIATLIGFSGGATNWFVWYNINFPPYLNLGVAVYAMLLAYGVFRYQFLGVDVFIRKAVVFAGLFGFVYGTFTIVTLLGQRFFSYLFGGNQWFAMVPTVLIIIFALKPLETLLINITDKYLFQKKYNPTKLLKTFTSDILTLLDLDKLVRTTITTLVGGLNLESCGIFLLNRTEDKYELQGGHGVPENQIYLNVDNSFVAYLKKANGHLLYEETLPAQIKSEMKKVTAELVIPLWHQSQMIGIIVLGKKKSGQDYATEDIDILTSLARTESVALSNARLFGEAKQNVKLAAIGALAAGINHEVCNPLNRMMSGIQIFLKSKEKGLYEDKSDKELLTMGDQIMIDSMDEIRKIASITRKLSDFSKPERDVIQERVSIDESLREALVVLGHQLELKKIEFHKEIKKPLFILADKVQIQEVFFNLIRNAIQAIEQKGVITFSARENGDKVFIDISDTGQGIPEDRLHKLYTPFYTTKAEGEGTGLGLAIVRQIVMRNKGEISVKSKVGEGTTFTLQFQKA